MNKINVKNSLLDQLYNPTDDLDECIRDMLIEKIHSLSHQLFEEEILQKLYKFKSQGDLNEQ